MNKAFPSLLLLLLYCSAVLHAQTPWRFENDVRDYAYRAIDNPPAPGCTLFVGSSSFRLWETLEQTFSGYEAVNRGFGGSTFPDNLQAIERIHLQAHPARVVIFCGTNDIADGADAETVFKNFKFYIARTWNENPTAEIYFVSTTHAPVREKFWATGDDLFAKVTELSKTVKGLYTIDIRKAMQNANGQVREDLFVADRLHLNDAGYAIWEKVFKEKLDAQDKARQKPNLM
jgi:lysophospholipase L1-like esterase